MPANVQPTELSLSIGPVQVDPDNTSPCPSIYELHFMEMITLVLWTTQILVAEEKTFGNCLMGWDKKGMCVKGWLVDSGAVGCFRGLETALGMACVTVNIVSCFTWAHKLTMLNI